MMRLKQMMLIAGLAVSEMSMAAIGGTLSVSQGYVGYVDNITGKVILSQEGAFNPVDKVTYAVYQNYMRGSFHLDVMKGSTSPLGHCIFDVGYNDDGAPIVNACVYIGSKTTGLHTVSCMQNNIVVLVSVDSDHPQQVCSGDTTLHQDDVLGITFQ